MRRCLQLATLGIGNTYPNPSVGCVIVHENKIIGEGFTSEYGGSHAEVNAINSVKNKTLLKQATLYVTLEPCSHFGKTPPCSDLIIKHQIPKVFIGTIDLHQKVAGKGVEKLRAAGCDAHVGCLEDKCKAQHRRFLTFHNKKRPYIVLKWAQSADGFIAPSYEQRNKVGPVWITNIRSRQLVHRWRAEEHAILVGTNTVLKDNPSLTTRDWSGSSPIRIVIDKKNKLPKNATVFDGKVKTIVITDSKSEQYSNESLIYEPINFEAAIPEQICEILVKHHILSVIIEGGSKTLQSFIAIGLWDEARIFKGSTKLNYGIKAPEIEGAIISEKKVLSDSLIIINRSN